MPFTTVTLDGNWNWDNKLLHFTTNGLYSKFSLLFSKAQSDACIFNTCIEIMYMYFLLTFTHWSMSVCLESDCQTTDNSWTTASNAHLWVEDTADWLKYKWRNVIASESLESWDELLTVFVSPTTYSSHLWLNNVSGPFFVQCYYNLSKSPKQ